MAQRWEADVMIKDVNGMETFASVTVEAPSREEAKEAAKEAALEQVEFTGEHVSMSARVADEHLHPLP
ncbi:MAG: hypothetical protein NVS2B7_29870 [Herpetosiphon sp.]